MYNQSFSSDLGGLTLREVDRGKGRGKLLALSWFDGRDWVDASYLPVDSTDNDILQAVREVQYLREGSDCH